MKNGILPVIRMRYLDLKLFSPVSIWFATLFLTLGAAYGVEPMVLPSGALTVNLGNPLVRNGPEAFDYWKTGPRAILIDGDTYKMWYEALGTDDVTQVAYATSVDGLTWIKQGVVMSPGEAWEGNEVSPNSVLFEDGVYKMWYHAGGYSISGARYGAAQIGYATSADGIDWTKSSANPVLALGDTGAFDDSQVAEPRIVKVDTTYRMYYTGQDSSNAKALGLAVSADGIAWTKYSGSPVISADRWGGWGGAFVVDSVTGVWSLWHARSDDGSGINYKWSPDGIDWSDGPTNPVLVPSGDPNTADGLAIGDSVSGYFDGTAYRIMYSAFNSDYGGTGRLEAICLATIDAAAASQTATTEPRGAISRR